MFFGRLKRYMPSGLYGRAALILVLPVITLQLVISVSFIQRHFDGVTRQMSRAVVRELAFLASEAEAAGDVEAARRAAAAVAEPLALQIALPAQAAPPADVRRFYDLSGRVVIDTLRSGLPMLEAVRLADDRRVEVWLALPQGVIEIGFDRQRVSASNPHQLLVLMVVLGVLMTVIAYLFLRNQLRPIKRLAAAAAEYGKGRIVPYHPSGATEVRAAGTAFLEMRNRIERQTQSRTMMLSGVSHDLRTPLTRLRLGLSLMDEAEAAPLIRDVDEMQRLTDAFLDFARGDAGDAVQLSDAVALVRAVVEDRARDRARDGAGVVLAAVTGDPCPVPMRPVAIRRALDNLIGNALRYGTRAEVSVAFGDRALRLTVEDDGPGIPEGREDEAMRPFTRLDPARNQDRGTGVGLGLAIVADIARSHGGRLRLGRSARLGGLEAEVIVPR